MGVYYTVRQSDCLSSIAKKSGFSSYETIYLHPLNAAFREKRPNPNVIYPGDVLYIPDRQEKDVSCATDQCHYFKLKRTKVYLRLCLQDDLRQPYANTKYRLRVEGDFYNGVTDAAGMLLQEIPADALDGEVTIFPLAPDPSQVGDPSDDGYTFKLNLGHLDPIDVPSGVDARLSNLGFRLPDSEYPAWSDDDRRTALQAFQAEYGLAITGKPDDATRQKLRELHDGE